jgi:hypothetical protein
VKRIRRSSRWLRSMACVVLAGAAMCQGQMASQQPRVRQQAPIAMGALPGGVLVVLGVHGRLSLVRSDTGVAHPIKETLGYYSPADMAPSRMFDRDVIFVTMYSTAVFGAQQSVERHGLVTEYSSDGKPMRTWSALNRAFDGIAADPIHGLLYLGDGVRGEISTLDVQQGAANAEPKFLIEATGVSRLGSLAVDADHRRLFAADVGKGSIYVVDLQTRKSRPLVSSMGEPAALAYDATKARLYVADAARRCIWQVPLKTRYPRASVFSSASELREPRGLAIDPGNNLWVADFGAQAVFKLGPQGQVVQRVVP